VTSTVCAELDPSAHMGCIRLPFPNWVWHLDYLRIEQGLSEAYNRISKNINELNTIKCEVAKKLLRSFYI
jgi:hypothetical protein